MNGLKINLGDAIELMDSEWMGETLFGKVRWLENEKYTGYAANLNNSFTVPLKKDNQIRLIQNYAEFYETRYDKEHGKGSFKKLKKAMIEDKSNDS